MNPLIGWIALQLFFFKDGFSIKKPTNTDMTLNKEETHLNMKKKLLKYLLQLYNHYSNR